MYNKSAILCNIQFIPFCVDDKGDNGGDIGAWRPVSSVFFPPLTLLELTDTAERAGEGGGAVGGVSLVLVWPEMLLVDCSCLVCGKGWTLSLANTSSEGLLSLG